jgi:(2Fe-2S) ferredoxin
MPQHQLLICQNRTCRRQGAAAVLAAFKTLPVEGVTIEGCGCLGQCGSGPMVLVLPEQIWYAAVHPTDVPTLVQSHLRGGVPVQRLIHRQAQQG